MKETMSQAMHHSIIRQIEALQALQTRIIDSSFSEALELLAECRGRAILLGMKQSGLIGHKIAASWYETGLSTHMLNAAETWEENLSMVGGGDVIVMLSYSGKTPELLQLYPAIKQMGNKVIVITGDPNGAVAAQADVVLDASVEEHIVQGQQEPTVYTTVLLAIGDAVAEALFIRRLTSSPQAQQSDQKMVWVRDIVQKDNIASVSPDCKLKDVMQAMSSAGSPFCLVQESGVLCGVITDVGLRQSLTGNESLSGIYARHIMNGAPEFIQEKASAKEAWEQMTAQKVDVLVVKDQRLQVIGVLTAESFSDVDLTAS